MVADMKKSRLLCIILNLMLVYLMMMVSRIVFYFCNVDLLAPHFAWRDVPLMLKGALVFDTSAIFYVNALWLLLVLLPLRRKEHRRYYVALRPLFVITNGVALAMNLADTVYYRYSGHRTTTSVFNEFDGATNLTGALMPEVVGHWYLVLLFIFMVWVLWRGYCVPNKPLRSGTARYYTTTALQLLATIIVAVIGIRGLNMPDRPNNVTTANLYVKAPINSSLVLNTPFSFIRSVGHSGLRELRFMSDEEARALFNPQRASMPNDSVSIRGKNVVILLLESMSREFMEASDERHASYTPFLDSLAKQSLRFDNMFANGRVSVDAMPSIMTSLPMMGESLFGSVYLNNQVKSLPQMLDDMGYHTMFMHGAVNTTMHFASYMRMIGVSQYVGLDEYCASKNPAFHGMADYGNEWGIWDDKMLQFDIDVLSEAKQPFFATLFTLTLHSPHQLPDYYTDEFPADPKKPFVRSIHYTDWALRQFFETAKKQPWYDNTLFVITADHRKAEYLNDAVNNDLGYFATPLLFYTPDGTIAPRTISDAIAQQTDIMPTLLGMMGSDEQMVAFGSDLFATPAKDTWAFQFNNGIYQYEKGDYMIQFDGARTTAVYAWRSDPRLKRNLLGKVPEQHQMEQELKALIQQYLSRVIHDDLLPNVAK